MKKLIQFNDHGLQELDRIVNHVLDTVEMEVRHRLGLNPDEDDPSLETTEHQIEKERLGEGSFRLITRTSKMPPEISDAEKDSRQQSPSAWDHLYPEFETRLNQDEDVLFDKQEEAFIHRAVAFLKPRENKDVIISCIWNHITNEAPETFYSPEQSSEPEGPPADYEKEDPAPKVDKPPDSQTKAQTPDEEQ